ncbi:transposase [Rhodohalobacter sp.]
MIQQSYQRENISELASELGLKPALIYKWRAAYGAGSCR